MKVSAFCLLSLALHIGNVLHAQSPQLQKDAPAARSEGISAADVLDKYLAATGGIDARRALKSLESEGRFGLEGFHERFRSPGIGEFHYYFKTPENDAFELEHAQHGFHGHTWFGHNNGKVFLQKTVQANWAINGVTVQSLEQAWLALGEWDFSRRYSKVSLVGRTDVNGKAAYALLFTPKDGDPDIRYFDAETFLLVRMDQVGRFRIKADEPEIKSKIESYYSDYKDTGGIHFPRSIIAIGNPERPKDRVEFVVMDIKVNGAVDDAVFKKE